MRSKAPAGSELPFRDPMRTPVLNTLNEFGIFIAARWVNFPCCLICIPPGTGCFLGPAAPTLTDSSP